MSHRIEKDSLGEFQVSAKAYYGSQTARSLHNFHITNRPIYPLMIKNLGLIKKAAAMANHQLGYLDDQRSALIIQACDELVEGHFNDQFMTDLIQGGAGTSVNMNANEVIANRANELAGYPLGSYRLVHPNDHVNFAQSTNDVFPTAGKLTALDMVQDLLAELQGVSRCLGQKARQFANDIKVGRTHLQDAVPISLGQEFGAYKEAVDRDRKRIKSAFDGLYAINMGATAVGTGINTDPQYRHLVVDHLKKLTGYPLTSAKNLVDSTRHTDLFVFAHASLRTMAVNLSKMCNDLRMMASGPVAGLNEINLPAVQPGSSIMPGKVNPVILEVCNQVCFQVLGNDVTIVKASEAGQLELNVFEPVLFKNLFESIELLTHALSTLQHNCLKGITANRAHNLEMVESSMGQATALAPLVGYQMASHLAKQALKEKKKLKDLVLSEGLLSKEDLEESLDPKRLTHPGIYQEHQDKKGTNK